MSNLLSLMPLAVSTLEELLHTGPVQLRAELATWVISEVLDSERHLKDAVMEVPCTPQ
ncbi:MAG: hypothetical protein OHK0012_07560 [Synechococcales cyanobacterium]